MVLSMGVSENGARVVARSSDKGVSIWIVSSWEGEKVLVGRKVSR